MGGVAGPGLGLGPARRSQLDPWERCLPAGPGADIGTALFLPVDEDEDAEEEVLREGK